jgi:hypothetical protein
MSGCQSLSVRGCYVRAPGHGDRGFRLMLRASIVVAVHLGHGGMVIGLRARHPRSR